MRTKIKYLTISVILLLFNEGCNYLDYDETSGKTQEEAYGYFDNINSMVSYVYAQLPQDLGCVEEAMMESASDNAIYTWEDNKIHYLTNGTWSPLRLVDDAWNLWEGIRGANSFLENYSPDILKRFEYNADYQDWIKAAALFSYEVRVLRAYYYFELAKRYGDIPLVTKAYTNYEDANSVNKTSFDEVINFIAKECSEAAPNLPVNYNDYNGETGRVTQGMALALKSRALLYAASPLHNPTNDKQKWEKAAKAAYEVIKLNAYSLPNIKNDPLYEGGDKIFSSSQLIFERRNASESNSFEARNEPMGNQGALGGNVPTQNLVDAFEMADGTSFDWNNPEHVKNMYFDASGNPTRDPRLYLNVLTNESQWRNEKIETFTGGKHMVLNGSTPTGYYLRKYMNPAVSLDPVKPNKIRHHYILFRYAEILLNYAEAMNEWLGPDQTGGTDAPLTAREVLNTVRRSADMKDITDTGNNFTQRIRNERRVELAFEGHRFFDIRRWKMAKEKDVKNIYGIKITKTETGFSYQKVLIEERTWDDKMYLFPFPQEETYINNNLKQNIGW